MTESLKEIEEILKEMRHELLKEIKEKIKSESDIKTKGDVGDIYDLASDERDRELNIIISDRDMDKIEEIDEALERIKDGTYGICMECEAKIPKERLMIMPFAQLCVHCKSKIEKSGISEKGFKEEREYRKLAFTSTDEEES
ncbi:MAG: TraR/DksA family transcriptional regulator [Deltaproteobacteria bacterium]|uniref:TraR/DksA family transcriptional regulator n=1 Tax=Candidatus Zymogenus saltonus TaxID=2844893 RepID=A0A9D8PPP4_9DELT|nr:TraR/DksA family transcriptional regulator [Candidatus Zymogenus saltonus]